VTERIDAMTQEDLRRFLEVAPQNMRLGDWIGEWWPLPMWLEREARRMVQHAVDQQEHVGCAVHALIRRRSDYCPPYPYDSLELQSFSIYPLHRLLSDSCHSVCCLFPKPTRF